MRLMLIALMLTAAPLAAQPMMTAAAPAARKVKSEESSDQPSITRQGGKPGDINPFKALGKISQRNCICFREEFTANNRSGFTRTHLLL